MLTIIARPTVAPERLPEVKAAMLELVAASRKEQGCIRYELHQDNVDPSRFVFVETWESRELWREHMEGAALSVPPATERSCTRPPRASSSHESGPVRAAGTVGHRAVGLSR